MRVRFSRAEGVAESFVSVYQSFVVFHLRVEAEQKRLVFFNQRFCFVQKLCDKVGVVKVANGTAVGVKQFFISYRIYG